MLLIRKLSLMSHKYVRL